MKKPDKNTSEINGLLLADSRAEGHLLIIETGRLRFTVDLLWSMRGGRDALRAAVEAASKAADKAERENGTIGPEEILAALGRAEAMEEAETKQAKRSKKSANKRNKRD
jgi:hypothetical protein